MMDQVDIVHSMDVVVQHQADGGTVTAFTSTSTTTMVDP